MQGRKLIGPTASREGTRGGEKNMEWKKSQFGGLTCKIAASCTVKTQACSTAAQVGVFDMMALYAAGARQGVSDPKRSKQTTTTKTTTIVF